MSLINLAFWHMKVDSWFSQDPTVQLLPSVVRQDLAKMNLKINQDGSFSNLSLVATPQECVACGFSDNQGDIIETPDGYVHRECLDLQCERYCPSRGSGTHSILCNKYQDFSNASGGTGEVN